MIKSFQDLLVWQKAMELVEEVYRLARLLPTEETYALSDQMRRAAVSIPSNIAEGQARNSTKEFLKFLAIAKGSNAELQTQCLICQRLSYVSETDMQSALTLSTEIGKMLNSLITNLSTHYPLTTNH